MSAAGQDAVLRWLLSTSSRRRATPEEFLEQLGRTLNDSGFHLCRASVWIPTLHPELWGTQLIWDSRGGCRALRRDHDVTATPDYAGTPAERIHTERVDFVRCRLSGPREQIPYELLRKLADAGATDYYMLSLDPGSERPPWIAFTTERAGGFDESQIARLGALVPLLSLHFQLARETFATRSLLEVYLGGSAARRVLAGQFRRGTGSELRSAMWFCDMRGFTRLSDRLTPREVVRVLDAAEEVLDAVAAWSKEDPTRPELALGVGLHVGEVMFGNIGGRGRLDFTVIGGSVNELCRVEALCKPLGCPLLMTRAFASALGRDDLVVLGSHTLRGVSEPQDILTTPARRPLPLG